MKNTIPSLAVLAFAAASLSSHADVSVPSIFGDHMVLQRDAELPVWGWAEPGERVRVSFADRQAEAVANSEGSWKLKLQSVAASSEPREFVVQGKNTLRFSDVLVGEVWVCSGQSNMVASRRGLVSKEVGEKKQIRFYITPLVANIVPETNLSGKWVVCEPQPGFENPYSATGYFFALDIERTQKTPVGMIQTAWGGTAIQPWITLESYEASETYKKTAEQVKVQRTKLPELRAKFEAETLSVWQKKHAEWKASRTAAPEPPKQGDQELEEDTPKPAKKNPEPKRPTAPGRNQTTPTALFSGMVHPHVPFAIKGVLWYQGESNTQNVERSKEYAKLLPLLITGWREKWGQGDFPFLVVQLPGFTTDRAWAELRNSQLKALEIPNTGVAVTLDLNPTDNLHPPDKQAVGERLALLARRMAYGEKIVSSGPLYRSMKVEGNRVRVSFSDVGGGLTLGGPPPAYRKKGEDPSTVTELLGFEVAGEDGVFSPAKAQIEGETVVVVSDAVAAPVHVRYAWAENPTANLYNKEGLPASPFRSDDAPKLGN